MSSMAAAQWRRPGGASPAGSPRNLEFGTSEAGLNTLAPAPQPQSRVIQVAFWALAAGAALFAEAACRATTGHSLASVVPEWFSRGDGRVPMSIMFVIGSVGFLAMASDHCRNVWVAARGRPESMIFLGDRLRAGFFAARKGDASRRVFYVPHFVVHETHAASTFHAVWKRRVLLRDPEGNLTPARNLATSRMVFFALAQLVLLLLAAGSLVVVAGQYATEFSRRLDLFDAARALSFPDWASWGAIAAPVLLYPVAIVFVALRMKTAPGKEGERILPLPASVREGAVLQGVVVDSEIFDQTGSSASNNAKRFYRRFAVRFEGGDLPLPVHLNWWAQRFHEGNLAVSGKALRAERAARKTGNERLFAELDAAMASGTPLPFRLDMDLAILPAGASDDDTA